MRQPFTSRKEVADGSTAEIAFSSGLPRGEETFDAGLHLRGEQGEGFQEVFLGKSADVRLQEVARVAQVAVQVHNPLGDLVGSADIVGARRAVSY